MASPPPRTGRRDGPGPWHWPRVGVALPVYNGVEVIERCLDTLHAQTYPVDIYIADDGSDDGTGHFLDWRPGWYTRLVHLPERKGWPTALNAAAELAIADGCEVVHLMNADDLVRLDAVEKLVGALAGHDYAVCYAQGIGDGSGVRTPLCWPVTLEDFYAEWQPVGITGIGMVTARAWAAVGGFSTDVSLPGSFGFIEDWDFMCKLHANGAQGALVPEPLYYYVLSAGQLHRAGMDRYDEARRRILVKHFGVDWKPPQP